MPDPKPNTDPNRFPSTPFHWSGHGTLSAEESSTPYFLTYDPDNINYHIVDADGNRPDYLDTHYTIDVSGAVFIDQVPESANIRLTIELLTGTRSVFYLRMAAGAKATVFVEHLQGHPWKEKHVRSISR